MALALGHRKNFNTLIQAAEQGDLALMECTDAKTGETRAVICAANRNPDGSVDFVPFGHMAEGNPFDAYLPSA
jgi:hypothetical protein